MPEVRLRPLTRRLHEARIRRLDSAEAGVPQLREADEYV